MDAKNEGEMTEDQIDRIRELSARFRTAVESVRDSNSARGTWFERFPESCSDQYYNLFFAFLYENGQRWLMRVGAEVPHREVQTRPITHWWLEIDGTIVDISADQFGVQNDPIMVCNESRFHDSLVNRRKAPLGDGTETEAEFFTRLHAYPHFTDPYSLILKHASNLE